MWCIHGSLLEILDNTNFYCVQFLDVLVMGMDRNFSYTFASNDVLNDLYHSKKIKKHTGELIKCQVLHLIFFPSKSTWISVHFIDGTRCKRVGADYGT